MSDVRLPEPERLMAELEAALPTAAGPWDGLEVLVSAGGTMWELIGGTWVTLVRGQEPLPGTEPFFPL